MSQSNPAINSLQGFSFHDLVWFLLLCHNMPGKHFITTHFSNRKCQAAGQAIGIIFPALHANLHSKCMTNISKYLDIGNVLKLKDLWTLKEFLVDTLASIKHPVVQKVGCRPFTLLLHRNFPLCIMQDSGGDKMSLLTFSLAPQFIRDTEWEYTVLFFQF